MITYNISPEDIKNLDLDIKLVLESLDSNTSVFEISVYPDIHISSKGNIPVGVSFVTSNDVLYPLVSGKDIGCGVGFAQIEKKYFNKLIDKDKIFRSLFNESKKFTDDGLGSGNHFLSIEDGEDDFIYIIAHTGSRNHGIAFYHNTTSVVNNYQTESGLKTEFVEVDFINKHYPTYFQDYDKILKYASNRRLDFITKTIQYLTNNSILNKNVKFEFKDSIHNSFVFDDEFIIHRKGVTDISSNIAICPISMRRGSLVVSRILSSKTFPSCAHGAGRDLSRMDAIKYWNSSLNNKERNLYKSLYPEYLVNGEFPKEIISELDFAYKSIDGFFNYQKNIVELDRTKPILTIKH